jgi:hypothetical protein
VADEELTPDDRRVAVAAILATAVVRLRLRAALPGAAVTDSRCEKSLENEPNWLEVPAGVRLSVHGG